MATFAKVVFFLGFKKWGWEEELYWSGPKANQLDCEQAVRQLGLARRAFLARSCAIEAARIEFTGPDGFPLPGVPFSEIEFDEVGSGPGQDTDPLGPVWQAIVLKMYGKEPSEVYLYPRVLMCGGIAQSNIPWEDTDVLAKPAALSDLGLESQPYFDLLTRPTPMARPGGTGTGRWCVRAVSKAAAVVPRVKVTSVTKLVDPLNDNITNWRWSSEVALATSKGKTVHVHGVGGPGTRGINGDHTVKSITGNTITSTKKVPDLCTPDYNGKGLTWAKLWFLYPIVRTEFEMTRAKLKGRRFFGTRGRQPKR